MNAPHRHICSQGAIDKILPELDRDGWLLCVEVECEECLRIPIRYCPYCGTELTVSQAIETVREMSGWL